MAELLTKFIAHLRGMWRFRWPALMVAWLVSMAGWYWVYSLPDQFQASTQVYVDTDSALNPMLEGLATRENVMNQVELMTSSLLARPNLEAVAKKTDLDLRATTPREKDELITRLRAAISISERGNNIYTISYKDREPVMARDVVQTLLGGFVGDTLRDNREDQAQALEFVDKQIVEHERLLKEAETRLAEFKRENVGMLPGTTGNYFERLKTSLERQRAIQAQIALKERTRAELLKQLEGEEPTFGFEPPTAAGPSTQSSYDAQIQSTEAQLAQLRLQYTERHPDVTGTLERLESLKRLREAEIAQRSASAPSTGSAPRLFNPLDQNPVFQNMKINLSATEIELVELRAELSQQRRVVADLQKSVDTVPEVEAKFAALNRDYDVTQQRYEKLLERRASAQLGQSADSATSDVKFRTIDPPTLPLEPIGPNRLIFLTVTLLAGLGAGVAFSFLMDQLKPVFITHTDLAQRTGLPVLGAIGVVLMPRQKVMMRVQATVFALGLLGLGLAFAVAVAFEEPFVKFVHSLGSGGSV